MDPNTQTPIAQPAQQVSLAQPNNQAQQITQPAVQDQQLASSQVLPVQQTSQNSLPSQPVQNVPVQFPVSSQPVQQNPVLPQQNMQPPVVSHAGKETFPLVQKTGHEYASNPEVVLHPEVAAAGVEVAPAAESVIDQDAQTAGVTPVKTATAVAQESKLVNLPLSEDRVESIITAPRKNPMNSVLWLATLIKKILKKEKAQKGEDNGSLSA